MSYDLAGSQSTTRGRPLRELVADRSVTLGGWCMIPSAFASEVVSSTGCDWVGIDQQHGLVDDAAMRTMIQACAIRGTPVVVRVSWNDPGAIMRALDAGAEGVIVPMINTAEEAAAAVGACRYPPEGMRSWGPLRSSMTQPGFTPAAGNEQTVCIVMIETAAGLANVDAIAAVPGVDGLMLGPNDLALAVRGDNDRAGLTDEDREMAARVTAAAERHGLGAMTSWSPEGVAAIRDAGFTMITMPGDAALIAESLGAALARGRAEIDA